MPIPLAGLVPCTIGTRCDGENRFLAVLSVTRFTDIANEGIAHYLWVASLAKLCQRPIEVHPWPDRSMRELFTALSAVGGRLRGGLDLWSKVSFQIIDVFNGFSFLHNPCALHERPVVHARITNGRRSACCGLMIFDCHRRARQPLFGCTHTFGQPQSVGVLAYTTLQRARKRPLF